MRRISGRCAGELCIYAPLRGRQPLHRLDQRLAAPAAHQAGRGGKYTRSHLPVELAYYEILPTRHQAMSRERQIKNLRREEKLALISEKEKQSNETN